MDSSNKQINKLKLRKNLRLRDEFVRKSFHPNRIHGHQMLLLNCELRS